MLCIIFEKSVTVHEENQGAIALAVAPQMRPHTKHTAIKYNHFRRFFANSYVKIKHVDTKEHIVDIFTKPLDPELFGYLRYKING